MHCMYILQRDITIHGIWKSQIEIIEPFHRIHKISKQMIVNVYKRYQIFVSR